MNEARANSINPRKRPLNFVDSMADFGVLVDTYKISDDVLGSGSFGTVLRAFDRQNPDFVVAIKVMSKKDLEAQDLEDLRNEVKIMQLVDHPNIVNYFETYDD